MAVSPTPANNDEDGLLTVEEVPEASEPDEQVDKPETFGVEGPAVWDDGRQVDDGEGDTEAAMEAQVSEKAPDPEAGYAADINRHEVEAHQPFLEPQPCVRYDQALELEILNECLHDVASFFFEAAAPHAECLAFEATAKHQLEVSTDAETKRKATPCGWPCSTSALDEVRALVQQRIHDVTEQERRRVAKSPWRNHYNHSPSQGTLACDDAVDDPASDLLEDESYFVEGEDVYGDVTAHISSCKYAQRDEYGK